MPKPGRVRLNTAVRFLTIERYFDMSVNTLIGTLGKIYSPNLILNDTYYYEFEYQLTEWLFII